MRGQNVQLAQHGGLVPQDVLVVEPVAADVDDADGGDGEGLVGWGDFGEEGGDFGGVGAAEDEFVDYAIWADGAGDGLEGRVGGVAEDEVVAVEGG